MKILLINNTFGLFGGGSEKATIETGNILEAHGHQVYYFASDRKPYYIKNYEYQEFFPKNSKKIFYNREAKLKLDALLKEIKPDIIHVQCFQHNLTSSIMASCHESAIPTVITLHDCNHACPAGTLVKNGSYCNTADCVKGYSFPCIRNKCFNKSGIKSLIAALEFFFRKSMGFYEVPAYIICPSNFILDLAVRSGIRREKLVVINNFITSEGEDSNSNGHYFLYVGRIVLEKGVQQLVRAFKDLPHIKLRMAGNGVYENTLRNYIKRNKIKNIELLGLTRGADLENEYRNCIATILPTVGAEAFGLSILESFSYSKPVIASRTGGIPEVVSNNKEGILIEPGNVEEIKAAVTRLWNNPESAFEMGKNANAKFRALYTPKVYYEKLMSVYQQAMIPQPKYGYMETIEQTP